MRIGVLGTGNLGVALGAAWTRAGHEVLVAGRSAERAEAAAEQIGGRAVAPRDAVRDRDALLVAVTWTGLPEMLRLAGAHEGTLAGVPLIDPTNAVEHGVGELLTSDGRAIAEHVADWAPGAHVVKAFHLFPAEQWQPGSGPVAVTMAGDDPAALDVVGELVRDAGGDPVVLGPLRRARQLEEVGGFVIGMVFAGHDPHTALPALPPELLADLSARRPPSAPASRAPRA
ncbi:NADPH-dependent F420 reductase [Pseudonocardia sp. CA-107938]|uniref:NADPH-dependent F420 reductase n=1 Tax=Pseudonocardia sp. CA-107938 TaxID=3240021 RepID=UPI003D947050